MVKPKDLNSICPDCGAAMERFSTHGQHVNGHANEHAEYRCGAKWDYIPNFHDTAPHGEQTTPCRDNCKATVLHKTIDIEVVHHHNFDPHMLLEGNFLSVSLDQYRLDLHERNRRRLVRSVKIL